LSDYGTRSLTRAEAAQHLWRALGLENEWTPAAGTWCQPGGDDDGDGRKDLDDPLPFDRDNNNVPDRLQPPVLAQTTQSFGRRVLVSDYGGDKVAIIAADGRVEWEHSAIKPQDVWMLANGHILFSHLHGAREVTMEKKIVWEYASPEGTEVHGCQPLPDGRVMVVECGTKRLIEVGRDGKIAHEIAVPVKTKNTHDQMRGCRRTLDGRYLISAKGDRAILELSPEGKLLRTMPTPGDPHEVRRVLRQHVQPPHPDGPQSSRGDHPLGHFSGEARIRQLRARSAFQQIEPAKGMHQRGRSHAAEKSLPLQQHHPSPTTCRRDGCGQTRAASSDHGHIDVPGHASRVVSRAARDSAVPRLSFDKSAA
jgi:hypothetical protein